MLKMAKDFIKRTPLMRPSIYVKSKFVSPRTQNEEELILKRLLSRFDVPKSFVEFGFGGWEFNCAPVAFEWEGLLLDGDPYNVLIANTILPNSVQAHQLWITLDSLNIVCDYAQDRKLGILSIDVDGNDYWFLKLLLPLRPAMIIVEYNSALGLRPITIPYKPDFHFQQYPKLNYQGASLVALSYLAAHHGYSLIEVANSGINAFFVRNDLLSSDDQPLDPRHAYREAVFWDGCRASSHWERIKFLPFIDVTTGTKYQPTSSDSNTSGCRLTRSTDADYI